MLKEMLLLKLFEKSIMDKPTIKTVLLFICLTLNVLPASSQVNTTATNQIITGLERLNDNPESIIFQNR